jgi:hypothetical protein
MSDDRMINELEGVVLTSLKYFLSIFLEVLKKATKMPVMVSGLRVDIWTPDLLNTKQAYEQFDRDVWYLDSTYVFNDVISLKIIYLRSA